MGLGMIPKRVQYIMDRHQITGGKISTKQRQLLDHHFLMQREFEWIEKRDAKQAAKKSDDDDEEEEEEEEEED